MEENHIECTGPAWTYGGDSEFGDDYGIQCGAGSIGGFTAARFGRLVELMAEHLQGCGHKFELNQSGKVKFIHHDKPRD